MSDQFSSFDSSIKEILKQSKTLCPQVPHLSQQTSKKDTNSYTQQHSTSTRHSSAVPTSFSALSDDLTNSSSSAFASEWEMSGESFPRHDLSSDAGRSHQCQHLGLFGELQSLPSLSGLFDSSKPLQRTHSSLPKILALAETITATDTSTSPTDDTPVLATLLCKKASELRQGRDSLNSNSIISSCASSSFLRQVTSFLSPLLIGDRRSSMTRLCSSSTANALSTRSLLQWPVSLD